MKFEMGEVVMSDAEELIAISEQVVKMKDKGSRCAQN